MIISDYDALKLCGQKVKILTGGDQPMEQVTVTYQDPAFIVVVMFKPFTNGALQLPQGETCLYPVDSVNWREKLTDLASQLALIGRIELWAYDAARHKVNLT